MVNCAFLISLKIFPSNSIFLIIIAFFSLIFSPSYCSSHSQYSPHPFKGFEVEEKARLGSAPPSCHNTCNQCHPCMAVQVPAPPTHHRVDPGSDREEPPAGSSYSNYKPLEWKCTCGGHFYNP